MCGLTHLVSERCQSRFDRIDALAAYRFSQSRAGQMGVYVIGVYGARRFKGTT